MTIRNTTFGYTCCKKFMMTGNGMIYPMFEAFDNPQNATPTTSPSG